MQIAEGKLTISAAYGMKVPAAADFSSQETRLSVELEFPVTGEYEAITEKAHGLEAALTEQLKLAVYAQLGLGVVQAEDGSISPDMGSLPQKTATAPRSSGGGGGGGGNFGPTKAQKAGAEIPVYEVQFEGRTAKIADRRDLIAKGIYSHKAADFTVDGDSVWMLAKDGSVNPRASAIVEAIKDYVPFDDKQPTPL